MTRTDTPDHAPGFRTPPLIFSPQRLCLGVLFLGLTSSLLAGIGEQEPNNTRSTANQVALDANFQAQVSTAKISPLADADYFQIITPAIAGPLTLTVVMTPTAGDHDLDAKIELEDAAGALVSRGAVLASQDGHGDNGAEILSVGVTGGTTYYLRCTSADLFSSGSGDYTLAVSVTVPQTILSAYWLAPNHVVEGAVATLRAQVSGFQVGDPLDFEIREDDGVLGYDPVTTVHGNVRASEGGLFADATWPTVWIDDQSGDPEYYFVVSRGGISRQSGTGDADELHVSIGDHDDQITEAIPLGPLTQTRSVGGEISPATDVDLYAFTVADGQRIAFDVDRPSGSLAPYLRVFDSAGHELAHDAGSAGPGEAPNSEAYLEQTFPVGGTYYVGVSGVGNGAYDAVGGEGDTAGSTGTYTLVLSPGIAGSIRRPGDTADYPVDILRFGPNPAPIDPNQRTWIVIHGWMSSRTNRNIAEAAATLAQVRPDDQILTLDWRAADTSLINPFDAEASIVPVAQWAAAALTNYGFHGTNLNLVGHSFGSYVADQLAEGMGGVDTIVALDAAENIPGGFDPEDPSQVDFARDSLFSWSFHTSVLGSADSPVTADEAFVVQGNQPDPVEAHGDAVFLFNYLLLHPTDIVGQYFLLPRLLAGIVGPWIANQYATHFAGETETGGYEAQILTTGSGDALVASGIDFVPTPPKLVVLGGDLAIMDGDTTPSETDGTDFATGKQGQTGPARTFRINNEGGSPLTLEAVSLPAGFGLLGLFPTNVPAGSSVNFTVQLDTRAPGTFTGQVQFGNNAGGGTPFRFTITGTVLPAPPPELRLSPGPVLTLHVDGPDIATYTVEFSEKLGADADWQPVTTLEAGESWAPPAGGAEGFFRVRVP